MQVEAHIPERITYNKPFLLKAFSHMENYVVGSRYKKNYLVPADVILNSNEGLISNSQN